VPQAYCYERIGKGNDILASDGVCHESVQVYSGTRYSKNAGARTHRN
jgi:hypothetical protein